MSDVMILKKVIWYGIGKLQKLRLCYWSSVFFFVTKNKKNFFPKINKKLFYAIPINIEIAFVFPF